MRIRERYELAEELRSRYLGAGQVERGQVLDSFCRPTGCGASSPSKSCRGSDDCHSVSDSPVSRRTHRGSGPP